MAKCGGIGQHLKTAVLFLMAAQLFRPAVEASPCTDGTHSCDPASQYCMENNSTAGFLCYCKEVEYQLSTNQTCVLIPDSQRLYLTMQINTSKADAIDVAYLLQHPSITQTTVDRLFENVKLNTFKGAKFLEYKIPIHTVHLRYVLFFLVFTVNVTDVTREVIGGAVLALEAVGNVTSADGKITVDIAGPTAIFDTRSDSMEKDDMNWCAFKSLYSCRNHSTCVDVGLRYQCPCNSGYSDDGTVCFECEEDFVYGAQCKHRCACVVNSTESCDRVNGTCFCKAGWEGVSCEQDADECGRTNGHNCSSVHAVCVNTKGGFQCDCKPSAAQDASGTCTGPVISAPTEFETSGNRDLDLYCDPGDLLNVSSITWHNPCLQKRDGICTLRPQPPWDDGKAVNCTAAYTNGQSSSVSFVIDLAYPPTSAPVIEGYSDGQTLKIGGKVKMVCSVSGGKPLVTSVNFSCPGQPDNNIDLVGGKVVQSVLEIGPLVASDDGSICVCSANWKNPLWYTLSTSRILKVTDSNDPDSTINDKLIIVVAVVGGGVVVVFIIVVVIIWKLRGATRNSSARQDESRTFSANIHDHHPVLPQENMVSGFPPHQPSRHVTHDVAREDADGASETIYDRINDSRTNDGSLYLHAVHSSSGRAGISWSDLGTDRTGQRPKDPGVIRDPGWGNRRIVQQGLFLP